MTKNKKKKAPAFCLLDKDEQKVCLKDITTPYTLVYFYPKDNTPGCAIEANSFQKLRADFEKQGITIIGISGGDQKTKTKFCNKNNLDITLLSDTDFEISTKYDVYGEKSMMGRTFKGISRSSYLLDDNKKIIKVYSKVKPLAHPKEVLNDVILLEK